MVLEVRITIGVNVTFPPLPPGWKERHTNLNCKLRSCPSGDFTIFMNPEAGMIKPCD